MTIRDRLLRAAFEAGDPVAFVRIGRLAWLAEFAVELQVAASVDELLEAAVAVRTAELEELVVFARRDATLAWARVAALEVAA
ncbi:MAG: hypothetical protein ACXVRK_06275 [Gaiellaceae bacterium]